MLEPSITQIILAVVLALHLAHHRLAHRHISFVEVGAAALLAVPLAAFPSLPLVTGHLSVVGVLVAGSIGIRRLSPDWQQS